MTTAAAFSARKNSNPLVLSALESALSENGIRLSIEELAKLTGRSISTVRRALKSLSEAGRVKIRRNAGDCRNGGITNYYELDTPAINEDDTPPVKSIDEVTPPLPFDPIPPSILGHEMTPPLSDDTPPVIFGGTGTNEYAHVHTHDAAGDKDSLLSLKQKDSLVLSETEKDKDKTDSLLPDDLNKGVPANASKQVDEPPLDTRDDGYGKAALAFLQKISPLTSLLSDDLADTVKEYGSYPTVLAINDAANEVARAQRGERTPIKVSTWSYAKGILKKQKAEGDLPVEVVFKSDSPSDDFDPFEHEDVPETAPAVEAMVFDPKWQELRLTVESQNRELDRRYLSRARFGSVENGVLTVIVPDVSVKRGCEFELNYRDWLLNYAQVIWQDLKAIEFIVREGIPDALPETP